MPAKLWQPDRAHIRSRPTPGGMLAGDPAEVVVRRLESESRLRRPGCDCRPDGSVRAGSKKSLLLRSPLANPVLHARRWLFCWPSKTGARHSDEVHVREYSGYLHPSVRPSRPFQVMLHRCNKESSMGHRYNELPAVVSAHTAVRCCKHRSDTACCFPGMSSSFFGLMPMARSREQSSV